MSFLLSWVIGRKLGKIDVGSKHEDAFYEEIPYEELGLFQRQGAKRRKPLPEGLSANDATILKSIRSRAYYLDMCLSCCGFKFGIASMIGLIPWVGDLICCYLALQLLAKAKQVDDGLPAYIQAQMSGNIAFDFGIGLVPVVGDVVNVVYKANCRNCLILEKYLRHKALSGAAVGV